MSRNCTSKLTFLAANTGYCDGCYHCVVAYIREPTYLTVYKSGPRHNVYYLVHVKHLYDADDD